MSDPSAALQKAIYAALSSALAAPPVSGRVYDIVPDASLFDEDNPLFPYVSFGAKTSNEDGDGCNDGAETFVDLHVWSQRPGYVEAMQIGSAIWDALDRADLTLDGHALIEMQLRSTNYFRDPDGVTAHGVITIRALTEAAP